VTDTPRQRATLHLRMCDGDRDEYGGPEWVVYDHAQVEQMRANERIEVEDTMGMSIPQLVDALAADWPGARAAKALLWLARRLVGLVDRWDSFDPHVDQLSGQLTVRQVLVAAEGGDADPPAGSSVPGATGTDTSTAVGVPATTPADSAPATGSPNSARSSRRTTSSRRTS
jgi:hypothetical protein